jgi:hypothetical protein
MPTLAQTAAWYELQAALAMKGSTVKRTYTDRFSWGSLDIDYDYSPAEPATLTYPGAPETIEITGIWFCPAHQAMVNLTPLLNEELFSVEALAAFEERILESMEQASPDEE